MRIIKLINSVFIIFIQLFAAGAASCNGTGPPAQAREVIASYEPGIRHNSTTMNEVADDPLSKDTIGGIVSGDRQMAELLISIGLNPEEHRNRTIRQACRELQWNEYELIDWIRNERLRYGELSDSEENETGFSGRGVPLKDLCEQLERETLPDLERRMAGISDHLGLTIPVDPAKSVSFRCFCRQIGSLFEHLDYYLRFQKGRFIPLLRTVKRFDETVRDGEYRSLKRAVEILTEDHKRLRSGLESIVPGAVEWMNGGYPVIYGGKLVHDCRELKVNAEALFRIMEKRVIPVVKGCLEKI